MTDEDTEWFRACAHCGAPLSAGVQHPVSMEHADAGVRLYAFCDDACRDAWGAPHG